MLSFLNLVTTAINLYMWLILIYAVMSWLIGFGVVSPFNRFVNSFLQSLNVLVGKPLSFIRRFIPTVGALDFSPMILFGILIFLKSLIYEVFLPEYFYSEFFGK